MGGMGPHSTEMGWRGAMGDGAAGGAARTVAMRVGNSRGEWRFVFF